MIILSGIIRGRRKQNQKTKLHWNNVTVSFSNPKERKKIVYI